jgi:hypothetical protein
LEQSPRNHPPDESNKGGSGSHLLAECRTLKSHLVAQIEYAGWTDVNLLRQSEFVVLHDGMPADGVTREDLAGQDRSSQPFRKKRSCGCTGQH